MSDGASPGQQAFARFWGRGSVRVAVVVLGILFFLAVYAPFLAGEVALIWYDSSGLHLPLLGDLFNRTSYGHPHDLLFNIAALLLPLLLVVCWLLRRRTITWRIQLCFGTIIACWVVCMLPILPGGRALWDNRKLTPFTSVAEPAGMQTGPAPFVVFPLIPHRSDAPYAGVVLCAPGVVNPATKARFWLGTDMEGKDVAAEMLFGARISLTIGFIATGIQLLLGVVIGGISAYFGGWIDLILQRLVEIMMCFPTFILILTIVAMLGHNIFIIMSVIGLTGWASVARIVRGEFLAQTECDYVSAARAIGVSRMGIVFRHILPNTMAPIIITATFGVAGAVLVESGLSFLGMGDPTTASWGLLLSEGRQNIFYPWLIYAPGVGIFVLVTTLNIIGNGLRDAFDPKST